MGWLAFAWLLSYADACGPIASLPKQDSCPPNHLCVKLTGFLPNPEADQDENPSEDIARCFHNVVFDGMHISVSILAVTKEAIDGFFTSFSGNERLVAHIGLNPHRNYMKVEKQGKNVYSYKKSKPVPIDVSKKISEKLTSRFDVDEIVKNLQSPGYQVKSSTSPGTYYCNYILYESLRKSADKSVSMVHVTWFKHNSLETQAGLIKNWLSNLGRIVGPPPSVPSSSTPTPSGSDSPQTEPTTNIGMIVAVSIALLLALVVVGYLMTRSSHTPDVRKTATSKTHAPSKRQMTPSTRSKRQSNPSASKRSRRF